MKPNVNILYIICFIILCTLSGCGTICFESEKEEASQIRVVNPSYHLMLNKFNQCQSFTGYYYSSGGLFHFINDLSDFFCVNCKPRCLLIKAKNEAFEKGANFVVEQSYIQYGESWHYEVTPYKCPFDDYTPDKIKFLAIKNMDPSDEELQSIECPLGEKPVEIYAEYVSTSAGHFSKEINIYNYGWNLARKKDAEWVLISDFKRMDTNPLPFQSKVLLFKCK